MGHRVQRVRESNIEQLRKELSEIRFKDGESVDDFSMRITGLGNSITTLGGSISETEIRCCRVPDHLETLLDVNDLNCMLDCCAYVRNLLNVNVCLA